MQKPDMVLRSRPLKELPGAIEKLKRVVLFHPEEIVVQLGVKMCVCVKGERKGGKKTTEMTQCDECFEWFHNDCANIADGMDVANKEWKCEWCLSEVDRRGMQRWKSNRRRPKLRYHGDTPKQRGAKAGEDPPPRYSAPMDWAGKVAEIKEIARRAAVKKKKLKDAVEKLVDEGGHHLVDAVGMAGLELRGVDDALVDELVGANIVDPEEIGDDQEGLSLALVVYSCVSTDAVVFGQKSPLQIEIASTSSSFITKKKLVNFVLSWHCACLSITRALTWLPQVGLNESQFSKRPKFCFFLFPDFLFFLNRGRHYVWPYCAKLIAIHYQ